MKKKPISSKTAEIIATAGAFLLVAAVCVGAVLLSMTPSDTGNTTPYQTTDPILQSDTEPSESNAFGEIEMPLLVNRVFFHGDPEEFWNGEDWYRATLIRSEEELSNFNGGTIPDCESRYNAAFFKYRSLIVYDYIVSQESTRVEYQKHFGSSALWVYVDYYHDPNAEDTDYGYGCLMIEIGRTDDETPEITCSRNDVYLSAEEFEKKFGSQAGETENTNAPDGNIGEDMAIQAALDQYGWSPEDVENLSCTYDDSEEGNYHYTVTFYFCGYEHTVTVGAYNPTIIDETLTPMPNRYRNSPNDLWYFRFDGEPPLFYSELDPTNCEEGYLYCYDEATEEVTLITGPVCDWVGWGVGFDITNEHIYYSHADEPTKIYRADLDGQNETLICDIGEGEIIGVQYYGYHDAGKIYMLLDHNRVIVYDILEGTTQVVMEQYYISHFLYEEDFLTNQGEQGPLIYWHGFLSKEDQDAAPYEGYANAYTYYIETGENEEDHHL